MHVCFESLYISLPSSANSASSEEREPQGLNFKIFISHLSLCFALTFEIVLTLINKVNDFLVSRDS